MPKPLTRAQLAKFLPDQESIRRFEQIDVIVEQLAPNVVNELSIAVGLADSKATQAISAINQIAQDAAINSGSADNRATQALEALGRISHLLELLAMAPSGERPYSMQLDYLDLTLSPPHADKVARLAWNSTDDTLNIHHEGGVTQQVGLETYLRAVNHTGSTITNGSCVGFAGVNGTVAIEIEDYIADGTMPSLYVLGVVTQDIADNAKGRVTVWGNVRDVDTTGTPYGETWLVGDILYANTTIAGGLTNIKPTAPSVVVPVAVVLSVHATTGEIFIRPTIEQQQYYGSFIKTTDQTPAVINTAYAITFDSADAANGVSIGTPASRIVAANAGLYSFNASFQLTSNNASIKNVWLWFRKNGTDIANTAFKVSLESANALSTPSRSRFFSLAAADYIELMWAADDTNVTLDSTAATAFAPAAPACTLTVEQIQQ